MKKPLRIEPPKIGGLKRDSAEMELLRAKLIKMSTLKERWDWWKPDLEP